MDWFTVDKAGLAKVLERKGKAFAIFELIQDAWDTEATEASIQLEPLSGASYVQVTVADNSPEGFKSLTHAFTLFAESERKGDPEKRGRFNLGLKLVLALCKEATITSTTGTVKFDSDGRHMSRAKYQRGSSFVGMMKMTREELAEVERAVMTLIPPLRCETRFNGKLLPKRGLVAVSEHVLPTEKADEEGYLRRTERLSGIAIHAPLEGEAPTLYEMGIPVVELGGGEPWHVNVYQKIPLNMDRDNVTPAYLQTIRVMLANEMKDHFKTIPVKAPWLDAAMGDRRIESETVDKFLDEAYTKKRAIFDPSDLEANKAVMNEGYTVISGGSLSKEQWERVKEAGLAQPSGKIKPTHPSEGDRPETVIHPENYTPAQQVKVHYVRALAYRLLGLQVSVVISNSSRVTHVAYWHPDNSISLNLGRLGKEWFERPLGREHHELLIHEFAHAKVADHLTREFSDEVGRLFALLVDLALTDPSFLRSYGYKDSRL